MQHPSTPHSKLPDSCSLVPYVSRCLHLKYNAALFLRPPGDKTHTQKRERERERKRERDRERERESERERKRERER